MAKEDRYKPWMHSRDESQTQRFPLRGSAEIFTRRAVRGIDAEIGSARFHVASRVFSTASGDQFRIRDRLRNTRNSRSDAPRVNCSQRCVDGKTSRLGQRRGSHRETTCSFPGGVTVSRKQSLDQYLSLKTPAWDETSSGINTRRSRPGRQLNILSSE